MVSHYCIWKMKLIFHFDEGDMTKGLLGVSRFLEAPMETCSLPKISRR